MVRNNIALLLAKASDFALLIVVFAFLAMIFAEVLKAVFATRRRLNEAIIERWAAGAVPRHGIFFAIISFVHPTFLASLARRENEKSVDPKIGEMLTLSVGGRENAAVLYAQPVPKLMAQFQLAANIALDHPNQYPEFYELLTRDEKMPDLHAAPARGEAASREGLSGDREAWMEFCKALDSKSTSDPNSPSDSNSISDSNSPSDSTLDSKSTPEADARPATRARARLENIVARRLDALQVQLQRASSNANRSAAVIAGLAVADLLIVFETQSDPWTIALVLVAGVVGGLVGIFLRNLVAAIERFVGTSA